MFYRFRPLLVGTAVLLGLAGVCWAWIPGRFTGGGFFFQTESGVSTRISDGMELNCQAGLGIPPDLPNNLEVNWSGNRFHLETLTQGICTAEHMPSAPPPGTTFSDFYGMGTGRYNDQPGATALWHFDDEGEPGTSDHVFYLVIYDANGDAVLSTSGPVTISGGNFQAHSTGNTN
ncbi:MAG TPA: hypothetical protein VGR73_19580 [Bryobacteraceae bacterium]|nr:hypothetical protein [Bryobacteraceae bacterium]